MSLFPAYSDDASSSTASNQVENASKGLTWLKNDSFIGFGKITDQLASSKIAIQSQSVIDDGIYDNQPPEDASSESSSQEECEDDHQETEVVKSTKRPHSPPEIHRKKQKQNSSICDLQDLHISLKNLGFIDVDPAPSEAILKKTRNRFKKSKKKIMRQFQKERYFSIKNLDSSEQVDEENITKRTKEFNIALRNNPEDITMWLEYIRFQDFVAKENKVRAEMKMSIIEKAMESNPNSPELTQEMFSILDTFSTPDNIQSEAKKLIFKDNKNVVAWHWMVNSSLFNITRLSVPKVIETFSLALEAIFRAFPSDSRPLLDMLLECCSFLRQVGLWEHLWLLVQLSLELNLSTPGSNAFNIPSKIDEDKIRSMEDEIIVSGLPLGSLWLRFEYLRSCVHYLPLNSAEDDPQRVVFSSDVATLLHPVHSSSTARLISILLSSIKVPLIPVTHNAIKFIGFDKIPWALESPELLLATLAHPYLINQGEKSCLKVCKDLLVSPQCFDLDRPGSHEFFDSTDTLFNKILDALDKDTELRDLIAVWKMRWYRFLGNRSKAAMKLLKAFPQNVALYTEYALLCFSSNDTGTCFKVLERSLKLAGASPLLHLGKERDKVHLAHLYKTYIELLVQMDLSGNRDKILSLLMKLGTGELKTQENINPTNILKLKQRFDSITKEMLIDICSGNLKDQPAKFEDIMLPTVQQSWFTCHAWLLYIVDSPASSKEHVEHICKEMLKNVSSDSCSFGSVILEGCYETLVSVVHSSCSTFPDWHAALKKILQEAAHSYPNNLYILHTASSLDVVAGRWWSVSPVFLTNSSSCFVKLFTVFVHRQKMFLFQGSVSDDERMSCERKLYNIVKRTITDGETDSRRCPLLWRLVLQFVAALHPTEIKSTFYRALDLCPWVKCIYYDAAKMLPEEMAQIQDLLVEKELRVHITSEELEILRQDGSGQGSASLT